MIFGKVQILNYLLFIFLYICIIGKSYTQQYISKIDSLNQIISKSKVDSVKIKAYYTLASLYYEINQAENIEIAANKMIELANKNNYDLFKGDAYNLLGMAYKTKGYYEIALDYYNKAFNIYVKQKSKKGEVVVLNNISIIYNLQNKLDKAIDYQQKTIKIKEELGDKKSLSISLNNLGNTYSSNGYYDKALEYYNEALSLCKEINDKPGIANSLNNIGLNYYSQGYYEKAVDYFNLSVFIFEELNFQDKLSDLYNNLAIMYEYMLDYENALNYYNKSLDLELKENDIYGTAEVLNNIATLYSSKGDNKAAIKFFLMAQDSLIKINDVFGICNIKCSIGLAYFNNNETDKAISFIIESNKIAKKNNYLEILKDNHKALSEIYLVKKDFENAYKNMSLFSLYKDTILNEEKQKQILELQTQFETEKKEKTIVLLNKDKLISKAKIKNQFDEIQKQRILIYSFILIVIIVFIFSYFIYRLYIQKQNANLLLSKKNIEVELKNEEINDSIKYAKRIQDAVLPISDEFRLKMGEHFILFRPKDIVSGDFYWTSKIENTLIVAVADCTGHGVPGAFMSMLGISFLNEIIRNKAITNANEVLNELRKEIINALQQKGQSGEQKDGMDISLLAIDSISHKAQWAGANNPLWIVKSSKPKETNLKTQENSSLNLEFETCFLELKADKMPIAIYEKMDSFTNHDIQLEKGVCVYLMSDGYEDQFGGPKGKKFLSKNLKQLLVANCHLPMEKQKIVLETTLINWIGEGDQTDDITFVGLKIL